MDTEVEDWNERHRSGSFTPATHANPHVAEVVAELEPGRALDLACGDGGGLLGLASRGWTVTGVDFSSVAIEKARAATGPDLAGVDWVVADVRTYEPLAESYDLVTICFLHLPPEERRALLDRATAALAPGGRLVYVGHDLSHHEAGFGGPQDPTILTTPDVVAAELADSAAGTANLVVIERAEVVRREIDDRVSLDTLVVAQKPQS